MGTEPTARLVEVIRGGGTIVRLESANKVVQEVQGPRLKKARVAEGSLREAVM